MGNTISVSVKTLSPEASFKISSRCNNRDDWTPVRMWYLGRPDNVISNDFNPPDNVGTGTLDFSESRDSFASRSIEVNNAGVGGIGDDYEDSNSRRVSHGFLDLYSFLIFGGGFIIGVVIVYLLIVFIKKRQ